MEGAKTGGVGGFLQGAAQGIAGPAVALLKTATQTAHNVAVDASDALGETLPFEGRRRKELQFVNNALKSPLKLQPTLLNLEIIGANGLIASTGQCNPTCFVYFNEKKVFETKTLFGTSNPEWRARKRLELTNLASFDDVEVIFKVKDSFAGFQPTIGVFQSSISKLQADFEKAEGTSTLSRWVRTGVKPTNFDTMSIAVERVEKGYVLSGQKQSSSRNNTQTFQVLVTVMELNGVKPSKTFFGATSSNLSPYVSVQIGDKTQKTSTLKTGQPTQWKETFTFEWQSGKVKGVLLQVYDKSVLVDDLLGSASLSLDINTPTQMTLVTLKLNGESNGALRVKTEILGLGTETNADSNTLTAGRLRLHLEFS
jgi:hypothetical protein